MKFYETKMQEGWIDYIILGAIALSILYSLATGPSSFTAAAENINSTNGLVVLIGGTVVLVLFFYGLAKKFLHTTK